MPPVGPGAYAPTSDTAVLRQEEYLKLLQLIIFALYCKSNQVTSLF